MSDRKFTLGLGLLFISVTLSLIPACSDKNKTGQAGSQPSPQVEIDPSRAGERARVALLNSIVSGQYQEFKQLMAESVEVNFIFKGAKGDFTPVIAASIYHRTQMLEDLLRAGASPHARYQGYSLSDFVKAKNGSESYEAALVESAMKSRLSQQTKGKGASR